MHASYLDDILLQNVVKLQDLVDHYKVLFHHHDNDNNHHHFQKFLFLSFLDYHYHHHDYHQLYVLFCLRFSDRYSIAWT